MCGRYVIHATIDNLAGLFDLENSIDFAPSYNAAPGQDLPIIIKNRIGWARWGFIPNRTNAKEVSPQINARLETASSKPMFAEAMQRRRCLVPANGFYEWTQTNSRKQPYYIYPENGHTIAFAGIWSKITTQDGPQVTFAIITQPAMPAIADIHARMPVILDADTGRDWLHADVITATDIAEDAAPTLRACAIPTRINCPGEDDADLLADISET